MIEIINNVLHIIWYLVLIVIPVWFILGFVEDLPRLYRNVTDAYLRHKYDVQTLNRFHKWMDEQERRDK